MPTAFSGGENISGVPGCHLLIQCCLLLQGLVSYELTVNLSIFILLELNELWPYYQKHVNQITLNSLKFSFTNI